MQFVSQRRAVLLSAVMVLGLVAAPLRSALAQGPGSTEELKCILATNKNATKVVRAARVVFTKCIKAYIKGTKASAEACRTQNFQGKIVKQEQNVINDFGILCVRENEGPPSFGPQDPLAVNTAAVEKENALFHEIFGSDLDSAIGAGDTARCQIALAKALTKCQDAKLKEFVRCKKSGMRHDVITDGASLRDECLGTGTDSQPDLRGRIDRYCTDQIKPNRIARDLRRKCEGRSVDLTDAFGNGYCATEAAISAADLEVCLEALVECAVCQWANATDLLNRDCDLFDDRISNGSCGGASP
jgi:hypothetical protein